MEAKFVVDVMIFPVAPATVMLHLKNHRIRFEKNLVQVLKASNLELVREYDCSKFLNKPLRVPDPIPGNRKVLSLQFTKTAGLKLMFYNSNRDYVGYVVDAFNDFIEANKDQMEVPRGKTKNVPTVSVAPPVSTKEHQSNRCSQNSLETTPSGSTYSYSPSPKPKPGIVPTNPMTSKNNNLVPGSAKKPTYSGNLNISNRSNGKPPAQSGSRNDLHNSRDEEYKATIPIRSLNNTGNSCFFNATMQALASCPSIVSRCHQLSRIMAHHRSMINVKYDDNIKKDKLNVFKGFLEIIQLLTAETRKIEDKDLKEIRKRAGCLDKKFDSNEQQDAQEYLSLIIGAIDEIILEKVNTESNTIADGDAVFVKSLAELNPQNSILSYTERQYECERCSETTVEALIRNAIFHLPIEDKNKQSIELLDLLQEYFRSVSLEKRCASCQNEYAIRRERFVKFSQCILLNPQRAQFFGERTRDNRQINVPMHLDLTKFASFAKHESDENLDSNGVETPQRYFSKQNSVKKLILNGGKFCSPFKVLGGSKISSADEDIQFDNEIINNPFHFELMSCPKELEQMNDLLGIKYNKGLMKRHIATLQDKPSTDMKKSDEPQEKSGIKGDGNCFFRAISWCLTGTEKHHKQVRKALVEYMKNNQSALEKHCTALRYDEHVDEMSEDGEWATGCEIAAMSKLLNINIYTFLQSGWSCQQPQTGVMSKKGSIYLNNQTEHYEPVLSLVKHVVDSRNGRALKRRSVRSDDDEEEEEDDGNVNKKSGFPLENKNGTPAKPSIRQQPRRSCNTKEKPKDAEPSEIVLYELVAAICHVEDEKNQLGHYYAFTKNLNDEKWLMCNDSSISDIDVRKVISEVSSDCHLLFYERQ